MLRGLLLKPTLNLLEWILRREDGNSLIIGSPMGWSWQSTLDTTHHGALAGPANAHRHSDLASIGIDDHHARDHAARHSSGQPDAVSLDASQIGTGRFGKSRLEWTLNKLLKGAGAGADPTEISIGTGAGDVAAGNHTHTLAQDILGSAVDSTTTETSGTFAEHSENIAPGASLDVATKTQSYAANSLAVGVAYAHGCCLYAQLKLRLIMGGVQVAESAAISGGVTVNTLVIATRALSGSQSVIARLYNPHATLTEIYRSQGRSTASGKVGNGVAAGSVKI